MVNSATMAEPKYGNYQLHLLVRHDTSAGVFNAYQDSIGHIYLWTEKS